MSLPSSLRSFWRLMQLALVILSGFLVFFLLYDRKGEGGRIAWMQWMSRRFLRLLHCEVSLIGKVPEHGLIVSNHLSYVDILVIGSVCPALFVAKSDVREWPVFGWLTLLAGTLYVQRQARTAVNQEIHTVNSRLSEGYPVVIFPEGTSSDGSKVLPFKSSFLQSLQDTGSPVTAAAVGYNLKESGSVGEEIAYWGEMTLVPHLLNLLSKKSFRALLSFGPTHPSYGNRKEDASRLHAEVSELLRDLQPH